MRRTTAMTIAAVGVMAIGAGPAAAGTALEYPTFPTSESIGAGSSGKGKVAGTIDSPQADCVPDRKVKLYRKRNGDKKKLGSDKTDADGKWKVKLSNLKNGKYFYEVKDTDLAPAETGETRVCLGFKSDKLDVN